MTRVSVAALRRALGSCDAACAAWQHVLYSARNTHNEAEVEAAETALVRCELQHTEIELLLRAARAR
jgi:hypothetical protein